LVDEGTAELATAPPVGLLRQRRRARGLGLAGPEVHQPAALGCPVGENAALGQALPRGKVGKAAQLAALAVEGPAVVAALDIPLRRDATEGQGRAAVEEIGRAQCRGGGETAGCGGCGT